MLYRSHPLTVHPATITLAGDRRARRILWSLAATAVGTLTVMSVGAYYLNQYFPTPPAREKPVNTDICRTPLGPVMAHCHLRP